MLTYYQVKILKRIGCKNMFLNIVSVSCQIACEVTGKQTLSRIKTHRIRKFLKVKIFKEYNRRLHLIT